MVDHEKSFSDLLLGNLGNIKMNLVVLDHGCKSIYTFGPK